MTSGEPMYQISDMLIKRVMLLIAEDAEPDPDMLCTIEAELRSRKVEPEAEQPIRGCWYYDHNVCGLPHPSPTADAHDAAVRKEEREKVLKELDDLLEHFEDENHSHVLMTDNVLKMIESLRGGEG